MNTIELERRLKALGIGQEDEVSYTLDGWFCTTSMDVYLNLLKQGRNVSMYHFTNGDAERCCAKYMKAIGEQLDGDIAEEQQNQQADSEN